MLESSSQESGESEVGEKVVRRSPDATFYHPAQPDYPTLIAEVSYSQQQKDLPVLAKSYIIDSSHAICTVVGFKIPYLPPGARDAPPATSIRMPTGEMGAPGRLKPHIRGTSLTRKDESSVRDDKSTESEDVSRASCGHFAEHDFADSVRIPSPITSEPYSPSSAVRVEGQEPGLTTSASSHSAPSRWVDGGDMFTGEQPSAANQRNSTWWTRNKCGSRRLGNGT